MRRILLTGGAGYVGSALVPKLLERGYIVKVLDLYMYGDDVLSTVKGHPNLEEIRGDIRDQKLLTKVMSGCDTVIHLACIANDPSFDLNPNLSKSINYDAFKPLVEISKKGGVHRFIYASSSSVYGVKDIENVTEDMSLEPITDYAKYKALCEEILLNYQSPNFITPIVRPASLCGYSPRLRLDLVVNIMTNHAVNTRQIKIFGGEQKRPNLHIRDMVAAYMLLLTVPDDKASGIFNVSCGNNTVTQLAEIVRSVVGNDVKTIIVPTNDPRSYHISSEKIANEIGFVPKYSIEDAVRELVDKFEDGLIPNSMTDSRYFNIKAMQEMGLK